MPDAPPSRRRYDKGRDRHKHVGRGDEPEIAFDRREPKKWVGKCPSDGVIPNDLKQRLLDEAIPARLGDRDVAYVKALYVVHAGAIYAAQTSDAGVSYHGYPYKGKLSPELLGRLRNMAKEKNCEKDFENWVGRHIVRHGERR
jgi:hypothetical protein